ncbi:nitrate/nitrite two-component system sensor histidine kinase NarQ [Vibrio sp. S4M6]|nr:nitrate/nitrite two-component system sensor histidine kinase NarQ [Vibrio sinus]
MSIVVILSLLITSFSMITLLTSVNDAEAVNVAGSMRMQSYRLAHDIHTNSADFSNHVALLDKSFHSPAMQALDSWLIPKRIQEDYLALLNHWNKVKQTLNGQEPQLFIQSMPLFVSQIDGFVFHIQQMSESMLTRLAWIGGFGLTGIVALSVYVVLFVRREMIGPLASLLVASEKVQKHQFDIQLDDSSKSEMGVVAKTFNRMAYEIGSQYDMLEKKVNEKTNKLRKVNRSLELLYDAAQQLNTSRIDLDNLDHILNNMVSVDGIHAVRLQIEEPHENSHIVQSGELANGVTKEYKLYLEGEDLGYLYFAFEVHKPEQAIVDSFVQLLSRALFYYRSQRELEKLILMEERATIARELHDSLAQSLSYLKIQVSRMKRSINQLPDCDKNQRDYAKLNDVTSELEVGLSSAYTQLRELLSTFRLSLKEGSLGHALTEIVNELSQQTSAVIHTNYQLSSLTLTTNQQVHVLQLIREAVVNAIKHANPEHIQIECQESLSHMMISVIDDGIGFDPRIEKNNHYGLSIMQERAQRLNGSLVVSSLKGRGSEVTLQYPKENTE